MSTNQDNIKQKEKTLKDKICDFIELLDTEQYPQICGRMTTETSKNRLLDYIEVKLLDNINTDKEMSELMAEIEFSLYDND